MAVASRSSAAASGLSKRSGLRTYSQNVFRGVPNSKKIIIAVSTGGNSLRSAMSQKPIPLFQSLSSFGARFFTMW